MMRITSCSECGALPPVIVGAIAMTTQLQSAIDHAYAVFAPYENRFTARVCTCLVCFLDEDRNRLIKLDLREIDGRLLSQYSWSAHGEDDDGPLSDDLRYLLPRYFELIALNDPTLHEALECVLMQLGRTSYRTAWSSEEVEAIDKYFDALLLASLANIALVPGYRGQIYHCALKFTDVLGMMVCAGGDVQRLLDLWDVAPDPGASMHMADQRSLLTYKNGEARLSSSHVVSNSPAAAMLIGAFLASSRTTDRIEAAFFETSDRAAQQLLSDALG